MKKHGFLAVVYGVLLAWSMALLAAEPLNINTATAKELAQQLHGIGARKAEAIVAYREQHGPYRSVDELRAVKGIGDVLLARNRELVMVEEPVAAN